MTRLRTTGVRAAFAALYALTVALVGFGHKPPALAKSAIPDVWAYVLPDGTVPVMCGSVPQSDEPPGNIALMQCDACLISGAPGLGPVAFPTIGELKVHDHVNWTEASEAWFPLSIFCVTSRGPPSEARAGS